MFSRKTHQGAREAAQSMGKTWARKNVGSGQVYLIHRGRPQHTETTAELLLLETKGFKGHWGGEGIVISQVKLQWLEMKHFHGVEINLL